MEQQQKKILVLVGASGSGKTTLGDYLKTQGVPELVSNTTRKMRPGEKAGVTYYYVTKEEILGMEMVERSNYDGQAIYGLAKKEVEEKLKDNDLVFFIADIKGAFAVKQHFPQETVIVYLTTTLADMRKHMAMRGDKAEAIEGRINFAVSSKELENGKLSDIIVKNGTLEELKLQFNGIILAWKMGSL
jgi:guanylate kinase